MVDLIDGGVAKPVRHAVNQVGQKLMMQMQVDHPPIIPRVHQPN